jgi:hypothetical protein
LGLSNASEDASRRLELTVYYADQAGTVSNHKDVGPTQGENFTRPHARPFVAGGDNNASKAVHVPHPLPLPVWKVECGAQIPFA